MTCHKSTPAISVSSNLFFANLFWHRCRNGETNHRINAELPMRLISFILNLLIAALSVAVLLLVAYSADAFAQHPPSLVDKEG